MSNRLPFPESADMGALDREPWRGLNHMGALARGAALVLERPTDWPQEPEEANMIQPATTQEGEK